MSTFSWVIPGEIAGMSLPRDAQFIIALAHSGIGTIVSLTEDNLPFDMEKLFPGYESKAALGLAPVMVHIPVVDFSIPTMAQIEYFIAVVAATRRRNKATAVHCLAGIGRTGTMIACYLVAAYNMTAVEAIQYTRSKRSNSVVTKGQENVVEQFYHHWQEKLKHQASRKIFDLNDEDVSFTVDDIPKSSS